MIIHRSLFKRTALVELLLLASKLVVNVSADLAIPACTSLKAGFETSSCSDTTGTTVSYCLHTDNKIYEITDLTTITCKATALSSPGVNVFKVTTDSCQNITGSTKPSDWNENCNTKYYSDNNCSTQITETCDDSSWTSASTVYKKITIAEKITISDSSATSDPVGDAAKLVMYVCDSTSVCTQTAGYIKVEYTGGPNYYGIDARGGGAAVTAYITACDGSSNIGKYKTDSNEVCLSSSTQTAGFSAGNYILDGSLDGGSIFALPTTGTNPGIVLTTTANAIYYNKAYAETNNCVTTSTKVIQAKGSNTCGTTPCDVCLTCTNGDCQEANATPPPATQDCTITSSNGTLTATGTCTDGYNIGCTSGSGAPYTVDNTGSGTGTCALFLISGSGATKVESGSGYFKNASNYFTRKPDGTVAVAAEVTGCTQAADIGNFSSGALCISASGKTVTFSNSDNDKYLIAVVASKTLIFNAETDTTKSLVLEVAENSITLSSTYNTADGAKDYFDSDYKLVNGDTLKTCPTKTLLGNYYSCSNGVCTATAITLASSTNYLMPVPGNKYCQISNSMAVSQITDESVTVDTASTNVVESTFYPIITTYTATTSIPNYKSYTCTSGGECTPKDVYLIYDTNKLAKCPADGDCVDVTTNGIYKVILNTSTPYVTCTGETCTAAAAPTAGTACAESSIGQLANSSGVELCLTKDKAVQFAAAGAASANYLVGYKESTAFATDLVSTVNIKYGVVTVTSDSITLDTTVNAAICVDGDLKVTPKGNSACGDNSTEYKNCANGVCYNDCIGATGENCVAGNYYMFSDAAGQTYQATETTTAGFLFKCENVTDDNNVEIVKCNKITEVGYHGISATGAYKCTKSGTDVKCVKETIPTDGCSATTIGKLEISGGKTYICLGDSGNTAISAELPAAATKYILSENTVLGIATGKYGIVVAATDSVILQGDATTTGLIVVDSSTYALTTDDTTFSEGVYTCSAGVCSSVTDKKIGYFKNAIPTAFSYVQCKIDTDKIKCANYTPSSCSAIGDLMVDNASGENKLKICLDTSDTTKQIELTQANNGQYMISIASASIFGGANQDKFVKIKLEDGEVTLEGKEVAPIIYQYVNASNKVYTEAVLRSNDNGLSCSNGQPGAGTVTEYKLQEGQEGDTVDYYEAVQA